MDRPAIPVRPPWPPSLLQRLGHLQMQRATPLAQQRCLSRVLHQRVLEDVGRLRRRAPLERRPAPTSCSSAASARPRRCANASSNSNENSRPITAPICATSLTAEPSRSSRAISEACSVAGTRERGRGGLREHIRPALPPLQHRLGQLLDEQRHAVRALDDLRDDIARQPRLPTTRCDQCRAFTTVEPIEHMHRDMRLPDPGRLKLGAEGDDQQHWHARHPLDEQVEQLARAGVDPVHILDNASAPDLAASGLRAGGASPRRFSPSYAGASVGEAGSGLRSATTAARPAAPRPPARSPCEQRRSLSSFALRCVVALEPGGAGELAR